MRTVATVGLLSLVVACGGAISPVDPTSFQLEGSYDLSVQTVDVTPSQMQQQPSPPNTYHPATNGHARVDIKKVAGAYQAAITVDSANPVSASVTATSDCSITLTTQDGATFSGGSTNGYQSVSDALSVLSFRVGADGRPAGAVAATGNEFVSEGDVGWQMDISAAGTIGPDTRAPQITAVQYTPSLSGKPLPWDPIYVSASEPVDGAQLQGSASLLGASGPFSVAWSIQPNQPDWIGATRLVGYRTEWVAQGAQSLNVAAGIADPTGNASSSLQTPASFLDVPLAAAFDATTLPAQWGPVAVVSGATACGADGVSCLEIGPVTGPCQGQATAGIAGRLSAAGHGTLTMKYRVRAASQYGQPYLMSPFGFSLATPGAAPQAAPSPLSPKLSAVTDVTYPYATDWTTVSEALPASASEVGFAFTPFDQGASSYCGGGPAMPPVTLVIDVVAVTTAP